MRKLLLTAIALALAAPALAAQQDIAQLSAVTASREALRTAVNTQLSAVQANFDELYTAVGTRPWVIQATAPADTTLAWFDTNQVVDAVVLKIHNGERWVPQAIGEGGNYTLPTAAADTLGGVKVGDRLSIADGVLSADIQTTDISGKENSLGNPSVTGYVLSSTTAGVRSWIEMTGGGAGIAHAPSDGNYYASKDGVWATLAGVFQPADADLTSAAGGSAAGNSKLFGTNSSGVVGWYDIPGAGSGISHATADGKWYGSKDGAWVDLAPTFSSALPKWIDMPVGHSFTAGDLTWYNGQVWKASGTHSKVLGEYPDAESADWEDYIQAPIVVDYPTEVGVPAWTAEGWAANSYTVGTGASNLVQLNSSAQLPAVSAALLTNFPTLNQNTTGTAGGLSGSPNITVGTISAGASGFGVDADGDVTAKSVTVTRTTDPTAIDLYEGTGGGDNKLTLTLSGNLAADVTLNADQILVDGDIGSTVQGYDADLATWAGVTPSANGRSLVSAANYAAMRTLLDLEAGTDFNAYDTDLTTWAGITPGTGVGTALATPSSANLRAAVTDESGTGVLLFAGGNIGAATSTGAVDFGGATSLEVPNGASPTVDAAGEIAVDTTSDQLIYYGAAKRVLPYRLQENFAIKSPVDADDVLMFKAQQAITITDIHVLAQGGGTISVDIQECDSAGANCATVDAAISADSDGAEDDGTISNGAIDAGDWVKLVLAAPSGTVNFLTGSIYYTITAD